jgi:phosphatidylglycerol---prolipoprotein diacylglyceryl transferase
LDTLTGTVPIAVIAFDFDPLLHLAEGLVVRWQTVALAAVIAGALIAAGLMARRVDLRPDDLLFIAVGIVPGAVIGGRIGYVLLHLDYYGSRLTAIVDPAAGGLELGLAVVGGLLTGSYVARLLGAPIGRWMHLAVLPVLFVLGAGKLTMALDGAGQGQPSAAAWATAYLGPGPWGSLAPALPSVPSQLLEGSVTLLITLVITLVLVLGAFRSRDGRVLLVGLAAWAVGRALVSLTWRDPAVVGSLNMGTLIAAGIAVGLLIALAAMSARRGGRVEAAEEEPPPAGAPGLPEWPEPEDRPRF